MASVVLVDRQSPAPGQAPFFQQYVMPLARRGLWVPLLDNTGHQDTHRPKGVDESPDEPASVLVDAPTVAMLKVPNPQR